MKKNILLTLFAFFVSISSAFCSVYIEYYNTDSQKHTWKVSIGGSETSVSFSANTTSSVTIQGGTDTCKIYTPCGVIEVKNGARVTIKNGCIIIK